MPGCVTAPIVVPRHPSRILRWDIDLKGPGQSQEDKIHMRERLKPR